jgi:iron complex outermembrane receptor protein
LLCALLATRLLAQEEDPRELADLDLQALMNVEVTSVSRRPERLASAAASVFVITGDEIRRSGATNLPEALRLAPNLHVVQVSANNYTTSARGFINSAGNKLLVLIDGRTAYTPLFSGVFWDVQEVLMEDIDRIEIISGPGGTLWGVNAVNGIINVITRSAKNTQGSLLSAGGGNHAAIGALRYGAAAGDHGHFRVYGKYLNRNRTETANGTEKDDASHQSQIGFRGDWERAADKFTLLGAAYKGTVGQPPPGVIATGVPFTLGLVSVSGANLTAQWQRRLSNGSTLSVQSYFDQTARNVRPTFSETLKVAELQFLHSFRLARSHDVSWGAEYRYGIDRVTNSTYIAFLPAHVNQKWAALFAQDEIALRKNLRLTVGARAERNDYTGFEFLPNVRLAWNVADDQLLWSAASRTVRAPSRFDVDVFVPGTPPFLLDGGSDVVSEIATVYELGYRGQPTSSTSFSIAAFRASYDHLRTQEIAPSRTFLVFANGMKGTTSGIEMWGSYRPTRKWRLSAGFTTLNADFELEPWSNDQAGLIGQQTRDPRRSWRFRSSYDLSRQSELDLIARHVSSSANPTVPAYSAVDIRYGWKPRPGWELSVTGSNLLGSGHGEFSNIATRTEVGRGVFIKVSTSFDGAL